MEKQQRWQYFLILAVIVLTLYNILPTVFYYAKPLGQPIGERRANEVALAVAKRLNSLEDQALDWVRSYCSLLNLKPTALELDRQHPEFISLTFKNAEDARHFRTHMPRAGALIPFTPAQLSLYDSDDDQEGKRVVVKRLIPLHFDPEQVDALFQFSPKRGSDGQVTPLYHALVTDRALQVGLSIGGTSENARLLQAVLEAPHDAQTEERLVILSQNVVSFVKLFSETSSIAQRYFASFTQADAADKGGWVQGWLRTLQTVRDSLRLEKASLQQESQSLAKEDAFLDAVKQQRLDLLAQRDELLGAAQLIVKRNAAAFSSGKDPWSYLTFGASLENSMFAMNPADPVQIISVEGRSPFFDQIVINWAAETITLKLSPDLLAYVRHVESGAVPSHVKNQLDQLLYNHIALIARQAGEEMTPYQGDYLIRLSHLQDSSSFLALKLSTLAQAEIDQVKRAVFEGWHPQHPDLQRDVFPVWDYETYLSLPSADKTLGLLVYAPSTTSSMPLPGFRASSLYVVAKGLNALLQRFQAAPNTPQAQQFIEDFNKLRAIFQKNGFYGYPASLSTTSAEFAGDYVFEVDDYYQNILKATREEFSVKGTKRFAVLEFTDVEQRLLTLNKIETRIHEDLLKWRDDYRAAQLGLRGTSPLDVPKPTRSALWSNCALSFVKYFRGDDRKILHWGLDLSGGKTVQIELRDANNRVVSNESDLQQGINELYKRVNRMGVSEVSIRQEGHFITLDFPGSQGLSAAELVKASSMYFHIVNEKFTPNNPALKEQTDRFLQEVWNEAVVTNRKDPDAINLIAYQHLYGDNWESETAQPKTDAARALYDQGLRFVNPLEEGTSSAFNDALSKVAVLRGDDFTEWYGQTHPLLIVFHNYAIEGANLENIQASYDPSKGNFLAFNIKSSQTLPGGHKISPQDDLLTWTTPFSKQKVAGTPNEAYSHGRGWRMAVILNGSVISAPTLDSHLKDSAMITGSFTQRELNQLEADLKAGSLSFTPRILSEKNVSPDLGARERALGIVATIIALLFVVGAMIGYYRFGGLVATVAVLFNLLIMWATLQNLQATMTLASIAGIILTLGTAVDANVLVFERIREEFALSGRIASAVHAGYRKAFSAILDSNVTTIIAAMILLHFDSGPIRAFAVTLIIGIVSSMFTALFMTRYFFSGWVQNPKNKTLSMCQFIKSAHVDFLKYTKTTLISSTVVIFIGAALLLTQKQSILGMDFSGGYALTLELETQAHAGYREQVEHALALQGIKDQEVQIRELTPPNHLRLFLSNSLEQTGRPFYGMPLTLDLKEALYPYENNPRITWVVHALQEAGLPLSPASLEKLDDNWTAVSGQMSASMRNNALIGLLLALIGILIYITLRFEFKYALSATLCLAHDLVFTLAAIVIAHAAGVPVQIDLSTVAALMTIVGYSLNDTIIVFDRIREDARIMKKSPFSHVINHALNVTLGRTIMTSGTTLLVLLPLVALGGSTLFGFALVMSIGVVFGTLSSLFIAAPLMQYVHHREVARQQKLALSQQ
jgi:SecD/SecF fusion protein